MNLSSRIDRVLSLSSTDGVAAFEQKSLEDMGNCRVSFGKAHMGKSFLEMWENEKHWVKWFVRTYANSQKEEHRKMIIYVEKMVQQASKGFHLWTCQSPNKGIVQARCKGISKAKAALASAHNGPAGTMTVMSEDPYDPWDVMGPVHMGHQQNHLPNNVQELQNRVVSIENALSEILSLIRPAS